MHGSRPEAKIVGKELFKKLMGGLGGDRAVCHYTLP